MQTKIPLSGESAYLRQIKAKHNLEFTKYLTNLDYVSPSQSRIIRQYYNRQLKSLHKDNPDSIIKLYTHPMPIFFDALINHDLESLLKFSSVRIN